MFNRKKRKIQRLEKTISNVKESYQNLLQQQEDKEQIEIKNLPEVPKKYVCDECHTASREKMKAFKESRGDGTFYRVHLCKKCVEK